MNLPFALLEDPTGLVRCITDDVHFEGQEHDVRLPPFCRATRR